MFMLCDSLCTTNFEFYFCFLYFNNGCLFMISSVRPSDFEFLKVIGKGSFGKVLLARHRAEGKLYAIKVLQKQAIMKRNEAKHIMAERNVLLKNVKHPFLVGLHYSFQTADKLYFVLDYVNGGEVCSLLFYYYYYYILLFKKKIKNNS